MDLSLRWDRFAGLFILFLSLFALMGCQAVNASAPIPSGTLSAASTNLDFGTTVVGGTQQLTDALTNHSSETMTITSALSSSTAFQMSAPTVPFSLAPGANNSPDAGFHSRGGGQSFRPDIAGRCGLDEQAHLRGSRRQRSGGGQSGFVSHIP